MFSASPGRARKKYEFSNYQSILEKTPGIESESPGKVVRVRYVVYVGKTSPISLWPLIVEGEKMEVTCFLKREGNQYASLCVELDVASCGRTKKDALDGLKRAIETYIEYMVSEGREKEMYRPVPMNELKQFLFPEDDIEEKTLKAIPLSFQYA